MNQITNIDKQCEHGVVAKYCFRCKRPDLAGPVPNIEEDFDPRAFINKALQDNK